MNSDLRHLFDLARPHGRLFAAATAALAGSLALAQLVPLLCGAVIDAVAARSGLAAPGAPSRAIEALAARPWSAAAAVVVLTAAGGALACARALWTSRAAESIARELRDRLHDHLQHVPCDWLDKADSGDLVQRCSSDVETVRLFMSTQVVDISRGLLMVLLALPIMAWLDPRMALVSLALFPPIFVMGFTFFRRIKKRFLEVDEAEASMTTVLQEGFAGMRVVRAFGREEHEIGRFSAAAARFAALQERMFRLMASYWAFADFLCGAQLAITLFAGATWAARGETSVGSLYAFLAWTALLILPVRQMARTLTDTGKAAVALQRISEVLAVPREADPGTPAPVPAFTGRIEIQGLRFGHADDRAVLDGIDLAIEPGQVVALVGPPGCGKSTIVSLLLRLHDPWAGRILLDGTDVSTLPRRAVRRAIASVLQEPFLYSQEIGHNLRVGRSGSTQDEIEEAARAACIHDSIVAFPDGYGTVVGERGMTLSGGQRQRMVIARTLLKDAPILVLDDALSAVDTRTEARIREAITERRGTRTCIVIAHRLTTTRQADVVIVLDRGRIVQRGTHEQLASVDGPYRKLWDIQSALEEDPGAGLPAAPTAAAEEAR